MRGHLLVSQLASHNASSPGGLAEAGLLLNCRLKVGVRLSWGRQMQITARAMRLINEVQEIVKHEIRLGVFA